MFKKIVKEKNRFIKKIIFLLTKKIYLLKNKSSRVILFFLPTDINSISGGLLSLTSIQNEVKRLEKIHNCKVFCCFLPTFNNKFLKYNNFDNNLVIFNFKEIAKYLKNVEYLELQIPEIFLMFFDNKNQNFNIFFDWINNIKNIRINILNQNETLMPDLTIIQNLKKITTNLTMTVAHVKYATQERRDFYGIPLHLLTPWTSVKPYINTKFIEKENIIIVSPDEIDKKLYNTNYNKSVILDFLKLNLPDFKIIIIENLKYEDYKKLISKAKFAITFGEGLDGYYGEPIFSGSVSFAVYNNVFFPINFSELKTVYSDFNILMDNIINDIKFLNNEKEFDNYNLIQLKLLNDLYGIEIFKNNLKQYYLNNYDFK